MADLTTGRPLVFSRSDAPDPDKLTRNVVCSADSTSVGCVSVAHWCGSLRTRFGGRMTPRQSVRTILKEFERVGVDPNTISAGLAVRGEDMLRALAALPDNAGPEAFLAQLRQLTTRPARPPTGPPRRIVRQWCAFLIADPALKFEYDALGVRAGPREHGHQSHRHRGRDPCRNRHVGLHRNAVVRHGRRSVARRRDAPGQAPPLALSDAAAPPSSPQHARRHSRASSANCPSPAASSTRTISSPTRRRIST